MIITPSLLDDIEATARAATGERWRLGIIGSDGSVAVTVSMPFGDQRMTCIVCAIDHRKVDRFHVTSLALAEADAEHIARMDPPTALALTAAYRAALAQIETMAGALREAVREIKTLAEDGTQRMLDFGIAVDPAERTYGPILDRIGAPRALADHDTSGKESAK